MEDARCAGIHHFVRKWIHLFFCFLFPCSSGFLILERESSISLCSQQLNTRADFPGRLNRVRKNWESLFYFGLSSDVDQANHLSNHSSAPCVMCLTLLCVFTAVPWPPVPDHVPPRSDGPLHQSLHGHAPAPDRVRPEAERTWARLQCFPAFV